MNLELLIAKRISLHSKRTFSKMIVRIAIAGIALGVMVMIISLGIIGGFKTAIKDKITGFAGAVQINKIDLDNSGSNTYIIRDAATEAFLAKDPKVTSYNEFANKVGIIRSQDQIEPIVIKGLSEQYNRSFFEDKLLSGKAIFSADSNHQNQVMISKYMADRLQLKVNDPVYVYFAEQELKIRKLIVCGIIETGIEELDKSFVIAEIGLVKRINNWDDQRTGGYEVFLKNQADMDIVAGELNDQIPLTMKALTARDLYPQLFDWVELLDVNGEVIIILMLLVAGINMISALLIMILERTNMIGLMKALGATNSSLRKIFLYNAFYLILVGLAIGNIGGILFSVIQSEYHVLSLDQASYYVSYVPIDLSLSHIVYVNLFTMLACVLMILIPSMIITRISPLKALRFK